MHYCDELEVIQAFQAIETALQQLCLHLHDELVELPIWIDDGAGGLNADKDKVIYALKCFIKVPGQSSRETFACVGAVAATEHTFTLVTAVNRAKAAFRDSIEHYLGPIPKKIGGRRNTGLIRQLLAQHGYPGVKLKLVTRHLKIVEFCPRRISFTRTRNNSYRLVTQQQAEQQLIETGQGLHIAVQLAKLSLVDAQSRLAIRWDNPPNWVANVATFKDKDGRSKTTKVSTSLPLFYLHDPKQPLPVVGFSRKQQNKKIKSRADKQVEEQAFLTSIHAFRLKRPVK